MILMNVGFGNIGIIGIPFTGAMGIGAFVLGAEFVPAKLWDQ
jgi:hypothetical protein